MAICCLALLEDKPVTLSGFSYIRWRLTVPMERRLSLSLEFKTVQQKTRIMHAVGRVDYSILEVSLTSNLVTYTVCMFDRVCFVWVCCGCGSVVGVVVVWVCCGCNVAHLFTFLKHDPGLKDTSGEHYSYRTVPCYHTMLPYHVTIPCCLTMLLYHVTLLFCLTMLPCYVIVPCSYHMLLYHVTLPCYLILLPDYVTLLCYFTMLPYCFTKACYLTMLPDYVTLLCYFTMFPGHVTL